MRGCTNLQGGSSGSFEDLPDALLAFGGALEVGKGIDLLRHGSPLLWLHGLLLHLAQLLDCVGVVAEILKVENVALFLSWHYPELLPSCFQQG